MSAIFGILRFDGDTASARDLERMGNVMAHRAPDGRKLVVAGPVGFGHGLMRVNREDIFEHQPLRDADANLTLVADCRIDNRDALADVFGIRAADLRDLPDSALVLHAYRKWGEDCAEHLVGDFAFALWDGAARKLVLARDHMGQRYVHYHVAGTFFVFATEINALWACPGVPQALSDATIGKMLLGAPSGEAGETLFDGIRGLPGATVMSVPADGAIAERRYWSPRADPEHENRDEAYYVEAYRRVLAEAVACRVRRTVKPPGVMFSGGYDSAAIAGLAGETLAGSRRKMIAAASVMPAEYRGTVRHARPWVEMCARDMPHLDVRYVTLEGKDLLAGLERTFAATGLPVGVYHCAHQKLWSALAENGAQLVLDGHGGDYTLNPRGQAALAYFLSRLQLYRFIRELRGHLRHTKRSLVTTFKDDIAAPLLPQFFLSMWRRLRHGPRPFWFGRPVNPAFVARLIADDAIDANGRRIAMRPRPAMRAQIVRTLRTQVNGAANTGRGAALHGLELSRPFHDRRVVELALAIPEELYVQNGRNRYLACAALRDIYPPEFQNRWRRNDDEIPDFQRMVKSIEPQLLADIARMEGSEALSRYVDFARLRALLAARGSDDHNSGWEQETHLAMAGFVTARFLEWQARRNR